jgi:hypothetical protein
MLNLTDLPPELRNAVYDELHDSKRRKPYKRIDNELALFTVSKLLHAESTSYFYQHNAMAVDASSPTTDTATILPPIADKYLRFLRRLTVYAAVEEAKSPSTQKVASIIASLATICANLEQLHIHLRSPFSKLLNSRVDDSVMDVDNPVTVALRHLLDSGVAKTIFVEVKNAWFAPGVAQTLAARYDTRLQFSLANRPVSDPCAMERSLTGFYRSTHLTILGLDDEDIANALSPTASSPCLSPISLASPVSAAFADLDTFSVTSFQLGYDDNVDAEKGESADESNTDEGPFFDGIDIEEWEAATEVPEEDDLQDLDEGMEDDVDEEMEDDVDEEMEDVPQEDIDDIMYNTEECADHAANDADVSYMTMFAPDLLLTRYNLGHLV